MASAKDNWVVQSPKAMATGEALAYTFDFTDVGTPASIVSVKAYKADGVEVDSTLSGSESLAGNIVTFKLFTPTLSENHRLVCVVIISGNTVTSILDVAVFDPTPDLSGVAVGSESYGTPAGVAVWVPKFSNRAGAFDDTTNPTLSQVAAFIDQISSILNAGLATVGFAVPVTEPTVTPMLVSFVEQEVAAMVEGVNGSGRLGPQALRRRGGGSSRYEMLNAEVLAFIAKVAIGMEEQGASRTRNITTGLGFRDVDESGDMPEPLFQREGFGEKYKSWDQ